MPRYIETHRTAPSAIQGVLNAPSNREETLRPVFAAVGARLEQYYISPDTMESILIWSCDDPARLDPLLLAVAATGSTDPSTWSIRRILTGAELAETARAADPSIYRPPGA